MSKKLNKSTKKNNLYFRKYTTFLIVFVFFLFPNFAYFSNITEQDIIDQSNKIRLKEQLNKLEPNHLLIEAAQKKAEDILKYNTFEHNFNDSSFSDWVKETKYDYYYVGENLAIDFLVTEKVINAWMKSETHKANLINKNFTEIGVAVVDGKFNDRNTTIVVQIFGSPVSSITNSGSISSIDKTVIPKEAPVLNSNNPNKLANSLIIFLATSLFIALIVKIAIATEHYYHRKRIHSKIKAKINL